jgi:hypothetical protein
VCANVATAAVSATTRQKETGSTSPGATRGRLIRQLLTESLLPRRPARVGFGDVERPAAARALMVRRDRLARAVVRPASRS